jgi:hypothetical protein
MYLLDVFINATDNLDSFTSEVAETATRIDRASLNWCFKTPQSTMQSLMWAIQLDYVAFRSIDLERVIALTNATDDSIKLDSLKWRSATAPSYSTKLNSRPRGTAGK